MLIAAERAGQNPRGVIEDLLHRMGDTEATLSIITIIELAHGIERANSSASNTATGFAHPLYDFRGRRPVGLLRK